jgi:hypothetical protein
MDCRTARMLLDFSRPNSGDLESDDAEALDAHLADCTSCGRLAAAERRLDDRLQRAMNHVEIPADLRQRLLDRLDADRADRQRRRAGQIVRLAALAAAILLAVVGWHVWRQAHLPRLTPEAIEASVPQPTSAPSLEEVQAAFKRMGVTMAPPSGLNYTKLVAFGLTDFQGEQVPLLLFAHDDDLRNVHARALVYVLSAREFDLKTLPTERQFPLGSVYKVEIVERPGGRFVYVFVFTGESLDWLRLQNVPAT